MANSRARVFISCGQQKGTEEVELANKISNRLQQMGFEPYVAVAEQTLKGLKENLFQRLRESEYFIFIDFKRERLGRPSQKWYEIRSFQDSSKHRGSLFSNQELAIATFLDIECLCFQESAVKEGDGILRFIQANSIPFSKRDTLPDLLIDEVKKRGWIPSWRNQIVLERDKHEHEDVLDAPTNSLARFYHINVRNLHRQNSAFECVAYLTGIRDLTTNLQKQIELVEVKWKGLTIERVAIPPGEARYLDGCWASQRRPTQVTLGINRFIVDYTGFLSAYTLTGPREFELTYAVFSYGLPPATARFKLRIGTSLSDIELSAVP